MKAQITNYIRAGYPGIYLVSCEEARVEAEMKTIAESVKYQLFAWSVTEGLVNTKDGNVKQANDPLQAIEAVGELPENSVVLLKDFHQFVEDGNPVLIRQLKETLRVGKTKGKVLVILGCRFTLPPELAREFVVVEFALPGKEEVGVVLDNIAKSAKLTPPEANERELLLDAASGLTSIEAENAFALSVVESARLCSQIVAREKAGEVKKNGLLEVYPRPGSLADIGGLEVLKEWLLKRRDAFGQEARVFGLPSPKGLLIVGIPGTGKSLTAKATASVFQRPLLKLDAGRLFAGLVGQSESNLRSVIATVEAIAPCVLWIDELEKGFSGSRSSASTDGGTSARVFGSFLSWLQDRQSPVFVVATANDVTQLPPELLRKGRFDELFFVDLPSQAEREAIWRIQIVKFGRKPEEFDLVQLAKATDGLTGSEIEQLFIDALHEAFNSRKEPTDLSVALSLNDFMPLSKLMSEQVDGLRKWAKGRARLANGVYDLRLTVEGGYLMTSADIQFILESNLKIGQFSFNQQDLILPVNGIPIAVVRTYNSINPSRGDFGYGWTFALNSMDVTLNETRKEDDDWLAIGGDEEGVSPNGTFSKRIGGDRNVTLTLPDGRRTTFYYDPERTSTYTYQARWRSAPGIQADLTAQGDSVYVVNPGYGAGWKNGSIPYNNYDFPGFILTMKDGTVYKLNRDWMGQHGITNGNSLVLIDTYGPPYLAEIVQRSKDKILISSNSVVHMNSQEQITSQIAIKRYNGLIASISDPNSLASGGLAAVKYEYDNNDNLMYVERLVDTSNGGTYVTNFFAYTNANFLHYITGIFNTDGTQVAKNFYDDAGHLIAVQDANGNLTQFIHSSTNNMEVVVDPLGHGSTNYYDLRGNVTATVNALGQTNQFAYDNNNYLLQSVDPLGHTNSYGYDANGNRTAVTNALGEVTRFKFDEYGQMLSKTNALMQGVNFEYDSAGHRSKITDALGNPTSFGHDVYGRPSAVTNAQGQLRATAGSDNSGNLQFVSQAGGLRMDFGHDLNGNTTNTAFAWVNPANTQTQVLSTITELDAANRVTRVTEPDGRSRMTIYDLAGRVAQSIDRMGNTNSYVYDAVGNVIQTTYADGSVTRSVYDARNQVIYSDDRHLPGAAANGTHNVYDPLGRAIRTERLANVQIDGGVLISTGAVLSASSTTYDAAGRVLATTNALGYVTRYEYDAVGRQTAVIDALTNRTDSVYDAAGQLRFSTNALGGVTEYQYDAKGRRIKTIFTDQSFTTNSYNAIGQLMFVKDQAGLETDYQYDNLGRMTNVSKPLVFDPEGGTNANPQYGYQYDAYGSILDIRDPKGHETKFNYDALGELVSRTLPLQQTNFNAYNALGQLAIAVDFMGQSNRFVYDSLGRVATNFLYAASATTPGQTNVFLYDANGRLYQTIRPEGITTFQYNLDGAVTNITSPEGWISYEYDPTMGWLTRAYTVNSDIRYGYDELSRLKTVSVVKRDGATLATPEVTTNTYTKLGSLQDVFYPNGVHAAYQYDVMNRLTNLTSTSSGSVQLSQYRYVPNANGWRLAATEILRQVSGSYVTNQLAWGYDNLGRLTSEASSSTLAVLNFTNKYVFDLAGNRLWKTNMTGAITTITSYTYNSNDQLQVESTGSVSFTNRYDANGSLTNRSSASEQNSYSYNLEGRLATATINQQQTNQYFYNQSGIRTRLKMSGIVSATNLFLNDPQNLTGFSQVLEELPAAGATPTATYTLGAQILSQKKSGTVFHLLPDGHGSTRSLIDSGGTIQNALTYDGYGNLLASNAAPQSVYLCTGERFDFDLRQYYLRNRYYLPEVGRFGAQDQMDGTPQDPLSLHKYTYCQNNPVNGVDPSGNETLIGLQLAMSTAVVLDLFHSSATVAEGYIASKKVTEIGTATESIWEIAGQNTWRTADTATLIVHGVAGHPYGWSDNFQDLLRAPAISGQSAPLNHDFYEFDWGGFSLDNVPWTLIPIKSVHQMALVHLQMAEFLVWMNGYAKIDIISHSWGTTLSYDLMNSSDIEVKDWVTMGSPLKPTTEKPARNTGNWINCYSLHDPVTHFELFPPFPSLGEMAGHAALGMWKGRMGTTGDGLSVDPNILPNFQFRYNMGQKDFNEHGAYWTWQDCIDDLRKHLQ
jgi:RHS repeat-associated protein